MNSRRIIETAILDHGETDPDDSVLLAGAAELWGWVLQAPVDDITPLQLVSATLTLTSPRVCDELIEACTGMIDRQHESSGLFRELPRVGGHEFDATLARLTWTVNNVDWDTTPGMANLFLLLACAFLANGAHDTAVHCARMGEARGCDEALLTHVLQFMNPQDVPELGHPDDEDDYEDDGDYWDDDDDSGGDAGAMEPHSWAEPAHGSETPPETTSHPFDTEEWNRRLEDHGPDITQPIRVQPPIIDRDQPRRTTRRRFGRR